MNKKLSEKKVWLVIALSLALVLPASGAYARDRDRGDSRHEYIERGHERYNYREGRFYRPGWFGLEFIVASPPIGVVVSFLPRGYRTIIVAGGPYYYYDNVYYRPCPTGYIVVSAPVASRNVIVTQPQSSGGGIVTINVPNSRGGYTPVTLVKHNDGYTGPQGEFYPGNPTIDELKALYGS